MKLFTYFQTHRALRARIASLEEQVQMQQIQADLKLEQANRRLKQQRDELHLMGEISIRHHQVYNAAEDLAKNTNNTPAGMRARAHWQSIR